MITNSSLTIYHKDGYDIVNNYEKWKRYNYNNVWFFGGEGATINKGYNDANSVQIRIPYDQNKDLDISNFFEIYMIKLFRKHKDNLPFPLAT